MKRDRFLTAFAIVLIGIGTLSFIRYWDGGNGMNGGNGMDDADVAHDETDSDDFERGPNDGRLLRDGLYALEITLIENGAPPEFRLFGYRDGSPLSPSELTAEITLTRLGGIRDEITFAPEANYLRGLEVIDEPHSFDVEVSSTHAGTEHRWSYESHEGRTSIPERVAESQGIRVESATGATIVDIVELTGTVQTDPGRISQVRARFPGVVTNVRKTVGDTVERGESLGTVETNESLRSVSIDAPISGLIVDRNVQNGQVTGDAPLFVIADLSEVWVYLDIFGSDLGAVEVDQPVRISTLGGVDAENTIDWVSPLVAHGSQSTRARVIVPNTDDRFRPGQFVRAEVTTAEHVVPLAVRLSSLQTFRESDVVFARVGDEYEVRMLELGQRDADWVEVLDGLSANERYVTENSYLIKADIEKSGASHDH